MAITQREARGIIRKAVKRVPEGEAISHLNIMPMMDIMTVLLVAFLFYSAAGVSAITIGDVQLPSSRTYDPLLEDAVLVTISKQAILVEGEPVVPVKNGAVDPSLKKDGALGTEITKLSQFLGLMRVENAKRKIAHGKTPPEKPELVIIADKSTPYRLLFEVIVTSRSDIARYRGFRLVVLHPDS